MADPDAIVNFVLENINQVLRNSPPSSFGHVKENFEKLQRQLISVKILLADFSKYNSESKFVKQTAKEIEEVLVEAEDAVDAYVLQASAQNSRLWLPKALHPIFLRNLERKITDITEKFKQINEDKPRTGFHVLQYQSIRYSSRMGNLTQPPTVEGMTRLIGLDGPTREVKKLLTEGTNHLEVISIAGMSGLGKTTLARRVYEDPWVEEKYDIRAFVYVSRAYNKKALLLQVLASCTPINDEERSMGQKDIENLVYQKLQGKRYLIVLDDVWMPKDWDLFKGVFPNNNIRCRVLITTRNAIVAEYANPRNPNSLYKLGFLNQEHSRELLRMRVFGDQSLPDKLGKYEERIVSACDGLPLVILLIAGVISSDPHKIEWWKEIANTVTDARQATNVTKKMYKNQATQVTEIVYKYLPNHLKPCFLYLAMFPTNFEVPVWKLVRFWISEGFIHQEENINLEDTAERYLKELIDRNLVMIGQKRSNGRIKTVLMLETLREFCKKEAKEENIFREINTSKVSFFLSGDQSLDQCRRLCFVNADSLDYIPEAPTGKRLRSFLTFLEEEQPVGEILSRIPKTFRLLKLVEAESLIFTRFPADFSSLVLLKYLAISFQLSTIPSTLSALKNLQTLIANTTSQTLNIKANIWQMPQFRHLHTNASASLPSPLTKSHKTKREAPSTNDIQTLSNVAPEICQRGVFDRTPNLKKLGIYGRLAALVEENGGSTLLQRVCELKFLKNLKLLNDNMIPMPSLLLRDLPRHLTKLTLEKTRLEWSEMSTVGKLEKLEVLKLKEYAFQGAVWNPEEGGFWGLIHLYIGETDLEHWEEASETQFPKLRSLELNGCDKLKAFPPGLANISSLQSVVLHCTNTQVASSAKEHQMLKQEASEGKAFRLSVYPPTWFIY